MRDLGTKYAALPLSLLCAVAMQAVLTGVARSDEGGIVEAESRFGHGMISGRVHAGALGLQVQLPGGAWVYCRRSCSETLRVETVDFFESNSSPGKSGLYAECGIFGCLDILSPSDSGLSDLDQR
jgi:hypothetical protein